VDRAYSFVAGCDVVFGFPDILFGPDDVFEILLTKMREAKADLALGLYRAVNPQQMDMTQVDDRGRVGGMFLKPKETDLRYGWLCAAWSPNFTEFLHGFVRGELNRQREASAYAGIDPQGDLPMGAPIKAAIDAGLETCAVAFPESQYLDIGMPENLVDAMRGRAGL
jgi:glucose-1-phosphate thymidylyltransferase